MNADLREGVPVRELRVGRAVPFGPAPHRSGIDKQSIERPLALTLTGLEQDEQGDKRHHGGPEKALHHYDFDHYADWRRDHPELAWRLAHPGAFGENISTTGVSEADVCVGDVFRFGSARIQVSQARQPCWRLNVRFEQPHMARWVQQSGRTGWYYRVLEPGQVQSGDHLVLLERPAPDWSLRRLLHHLYVDTMNREALETMAHLAPLAEGWRHLAAQRLKRTEVEDWTRRVSTPDADA